MPPYAILNGQLLPEEKICISPNNRSFRYGDGCFETMKAIGGTLLLSDLHFERLFSSLLTLRFTIPENFTPNNILKQIKELIEKNGHERLARIRLVAYRADGGLYDTDTAILHFIIQSWAGIAETMNFNHKGLEINFFPDAKKNSDLFSPIKSNNYLSYVMAAIWAKENGLDDSIIMNGYNRIADSTIANVFIVTNGIIKTPSLAEGCVSGVMRKYLINCFKRDSLPFYESEITVNELLNASEVFLTNTTYGIRWVQKVGKSNYNNSTSSLLHEKFIVRFLILQLFKLNVVCYYKRMETEVNVFWFRRDLRMHDNAGLYHALKAGKPVLPIFIFDKEILDKLEDKEDKRVAFIHAALQEIQQKMIPLQSGIEVFYGYPSEIFSDLIKKYKVQKVFTNHDYEPYAKERDEKVKEILQNNQVTFHTYKDQVILEKDEILKDNGEPYTVFTPYSKRWKEKLNDFYLSSYPAEKYFSNFYRKEQLSLPALESIGFRKSIHPFPSKELKDEIIKKYGDTRNFPGVENGTSKLGVHLRFGTVSIREIARRAISLNDTYLNELIWREFYQMILWKFPKVGEGHAFKSEYEKIEWRNNEDEFAKWCEGMTGYPIVDAGMRELNKTGFMHNRVRMIVASFLTKHLLIDWRWGEAYFAQKLLDYELASNNGGWQWAAGSGCDSAPFFRIFNPSLQASKFDKDLEYIKKWVPGLNEFSYPQPIVNHEFARKRALEVYGKALKE